MKTTTFLYFVIILFFMNIVHAIPIKPSGTGTESDPFLVSSIHNLEWISSNSSYWGSSYYYEQTWDIDASSTSTWNSGEGFSPIGNNTTYFLGKYDGKGFAISNLTINRPTEDYIGLFGFVGNYATLKNVVLTNLNVTGANYVGGVAGRCFGTTITITNCFISGEINGVGTTGAVGGIAGNITGYSSNPSYIKLCTNTAEVNCSSKYTGGVAGYLTYTNVLYCINEGSVYGNNIYVGGIFGYFSYGSSNTISNSFNYGDISTDQSNAGGIGGYFGSSVQIIACGNWGRITATSDYAGGIVSFIPNSGQVSYCFNTNSVTSSSGDRVGGITGYLNSNATISNCYNIGNISGENYIAGVAGRQYGKIEYSYSSGTVIANASGAYYGGLTAYFSGGTTTNSYWDTDVGPATSASGTGKTTAEMQTESTFSFFWDFTDIWALDASINNGYPYLQDVGHFSEDGTLGDPIQIKSLFDLKLLSEDSDYWDKYFELTTDLNIYATHFWDSNSGFTPIGNSTTNFTGNFDGQDYAVLGLRIARPTTDRIGFFGYVTGGTVANLSLENAEITADDNSGILVGTADEGTTISSCSISGSIYGGNFVGSIVGTATNRVIISDCSSSASVHGNRTVGGLIGRTVNDDDTDSNKPEITQSYSTGNVTGGSRNIGGFIGWNAGIIKQCYATGDVHGTSDESRIGGFVGGNTYYGGSGGKISNCYSRGDITTDGANNNSDHGLGGFVGIFYNGGQIENCYSTGSVPSTGINYGGFCGKIPSAAYVSSSNFWDTEISGQTTTADNTVGKTTAEMKTLSTFTNAGWDFVSEITNGNDDIWDADQEGTVNDGYPILAWQSGADGVLPVELVSFTADQAEDKIILKWQTATEVNNYGFEVERTVVISSEGRNLSWETIGFMPGHGNSNSPKSYDFVDELPPACNLQYRLKQIDTDGSYEYYSTTAEVSNSLTGVEDLEVPEEYSLSQNYPNPFNPTTVIEYSIPANMGELSNTKLAIYDMLGREIAVLVNKQQSAGRYKVEFDASYLSSGMYIYRMESGSFVSTKKLLLMK